MKYYGLSLNFMNQKDADPIMEAFPSLSFTCYDGDRKPDNEEIARADIICGYVRSDMIEKAKNVKWIFAYQAGVDNVVSTIKGLEREILFTNGKGLYGEQISEHLLAMLLGLNRNINHSVIRMQKDKDKWTGHPFYCRDVARSTVGVVGLGDIGDRFARTVHTMGARVLAYKRTESVTPEYIEKIYYGDSLKEMLSLCDTVAICLPGTPKTKGLFDRETINAIKKGACLLNIGRGTLVDTEALIEALDSGRLGSAGLDVTDPEPLNETSPLWNRDNVIITPHMAGRSENMPIRVREMFMVGMKAFLNKSPLPNQVNLEEGY
jgi:phosphoglycerate dehydrogenase-like enzyme